MGSFAIIASGSMQDDVNSAVRMLHTQGHSVRPYVRYGVLWFEIDGNMLASRKELLELADGVYSLTELQELFVLRRTEERGRSS
jgi:hypothetical protein